MRESSDFEEIISPNPAPGIRMEKRRNETCSASVTETPGEKSITESCHVSGENIKDVNRKVEKQVSWIDDKKVIYQESEDGKERILDEDRREELDQRNKDGERRENEDYKREKGSKAMKTLKLIRQKTVEFVQGKETEWKSNLSKVRIIFSLHQKHRIRDWFFYKNCQVKRVVLLKN